MKDSPDNYLSGVSADVRNELARVNRLGITTLRDYLQAGEAIAFLGSDASEPLYPPREGIIGEMVDAAAGRMDEQEAEALRALSAENSEQVAEILRRHLGNAAYLAALRGVLRAKADSRAGRTWTPVLELACRCNFRGIVTFAYDEGIVDARMRTRRNVSATGYTTWQDEFGLDRWRTGDVFHDTELPVLYAHGHQGQLDTVLLATADYRRAYAGKLPDVLRRLLDSRHVVWIGHGLADQRIAAIVREIASRSGSRLDPEAAPRHIAILPWDPTGVDGHPGILARRSEIGTGALAVLYPAPRGDNSALATLLSALTDSRYSAFSELPAGSPDERPDHYDSRIIDRAAGVQAGSGNVQFNYFYGSPTWATGDVTPLASPASGKTGSPYQGHAFLSYVREDSGEVDVLQHMLEAAGIPVWRDTANLWPGEDWRAKIRGAITHDALVFIACFSSHSAARQKSYQNEELLLAIDQLRRRQPDDLWLIPVRFDDCAVADFELGAGRTLSSIQRADIFGTNRNLAAGRLVEAVQRLLRRRHL